MAAPHQLLAPASNLNPRAAAPGRSRDPKSQVTRREHAHGGKYASDPPLLLVSRLPLRILGFPQWSLVVLLRLVVDLRIPLFALMARVYVGNLDPRVTAREIEDEFRSFGVLRR
nr:unnamed protein product [Digitaria exilis]